MDREISTIFSIVKISCDLEKKISENRDYLAIFLDKDDKSCRIDFFVILLVKHY
jgi:hypothetical protein